MSIENIGSEKIYITIDEFGEILSQIISNIEDYYLAIEDLRISGNNTLYLYLSNEDLEKGVILFIYMNPYTEDVYGLGFIVAYRCGDESSENTSFEEVNELAKRLRGYVASFHGCSLIIKEPEPGRSIIDQIREVVSVVNNKEPPEKLRIIDYSYDLLEELTDLFTLGGV